MKVLITGGAGFIGSNAASRFLRRGAEVVVIDNLAGHASAVNLQWLQPQGRLTFHHLDVRDADGMTAAIGENLGAGLVLHLASQVAVTSSIADPRLDFEVNALGTFNLLEAARRAQLRAPIIYASTNKVYGQLADLGLDDSNGRCEFIGLRQGISEQRQLDFHSPYACSKGAADQYVRDYHRIFGLNTVVMRQSCIYGPRQFGREDQGWLAWLMIAAQNRQPITIYGDGRQVRDILQIDDLLDAFEAAARNIAIAAGSVYNIGGGPANAVSLLEVLDFIEQHSGINLTYRFAAPRPGDQRVYISDIRLAHCQLGWSPRIGWRRGLSRLHDWVAASHRELALVSPAYNGSQPTVR
ncbi:MAG: SDR family NAD(P)-dependent oxidoreductase [Deltaproteobacteria bacterium]|nr:SDR family NAD(P)-dependent oxidoreductase [Deltaproteobacteria bacterium]MBV8451887.1 SDR family NAD(P)-dependent oxidoreductase [Deltaproteobacteria bacterium]